MYFVLCRNRYYAPVHSRGFTVWIVIFRPYQIICLSRRKPIKIAPWFLATYATFAFLSTCRNIAPLLACVPATGAFSQMVYFLFRYQTAIYHLSALALFAPNLNLSLLPVKGPPPLPSAGIALRHLVLYWFLSEVTNQRPRSLNCFAIFWLILGLADSTCN